MTAAAIRPRRVAFDHAATPSHWIPGDPFATRLIDSLSLLLPAGERWFVEVYRDALPRLRDDQLRADVRGFMGQEATHAQAHDAVLDHLRAQGIDPEPFTRRVEWLFRRMLGARPPLRLPLPRRWWLELRLGIIAAIEHFTCVLGAWVLDARALDEAGADPTMLELLRWHGAEEVEHRAVAHEALRHIARWRSYPLRVLGMGLTFPVLWFLFDRGTRFLIRRDPTLAGRRFGYRDFRRAVRAGRAPGLVLLRAVPRYLWPGHHPSREGSLERAREVLAPRTRAAAHQR